MAKSFGGSIEGGASKKKKHGQAVSSEALGRERSELTTEEAGELAAAQGRLDAGTRPEERLSKLAKKARRAARPEIQERKAAFEANQAIEALAKLPEDEEYAKERLIDGLLMEIFAGVEVPGEEIEVPIEGAPKVALKKAGQEEFSEPKVPTEIRKIGGTIAEGTGAPLQYGQRKVSGGDPRIGRVKKKLEDLKIPQLKELRAGYAAGMKDLVSNFLIQLGIDEIEEASEPGGGPLSLGIEPIIGNLPATHQREIVEPGDIVEGSKQRAVKALRQLKKTSPEMGGDPMLSDKDLKIITNRIYKAS